MYIEQEEGCRFLLPKQGFYNSSVPLTDEFCPRILENVSNLIYMLMVCWVPLLFFFLQICPDQGGESGGDKSSCGAIYDQTSSSA